MSLVSVIMPYYKKRNFFLESIYSALNQTYRNTEIIIVYDDTDDTDFKYICEVQKLDSRIKIIKNGVPCVPSGWRIRFRRLHGR